MDFFFFFQEEARRRVLLEKLWLKREQVYIPNIQSRNINDMIDINIGY